MTDPAPAPQRVELLPCPFCGPGQSQISVYFDDMAQRYRVGCGRCGCSTGIHPSDKTEAPAIAVWNRRAIPAAEASVEAVLFALRIFQPPENASVHLHHAIKDAITALSALSASQAAMRELIDEAARSMFAVGLTADNTDLFQRLSRAARASATPPAAPEAEDAVKACAAELAEFFYPANPPYRSKEAMAEDMALVIARHFQAALRAHQGAG